MRVVSALAVFAAARPVHAQSLGAAANSPLSACCGTLSPIAPIAMDTVPGLLRDGGMAAALADLPPVWRRYAITMHATAGDWRRAQEPSAYESARFEGMGGRAVDRWYVAGGARLQRHRERDVSWRNQSTPSLAGAYVWADSIGGTFRGDDVALQASAATPTWRGFSFGMPVELALGQAARRNDPRPLIRRRVMEFAPALRWQWGTNHFGVIGRLGSQREDLEIGGGLSPEVPVVFRLRGIATFDRTQLNSAERAVLGRTKGAAAAWSRRRGQTFLVLGSGIRIEEDRVRDGIATPVGGGETRRVRLDLHGAWRTQRSTGGAEVRSAWRQESARGTDPIFRAVNAIGEGERADVTASWWRGARPTTPHWRIDGRGTMQSLRVRDVAGNASWRVARWPFAASLTHFRESTTGHVWFGSAGIGHASVSRSEVTLARPSAITPMFVTHDHAVHAAPTSTVRASLGADRPVGNAGSRMRWSAAWEGWRARMTLPVEGRMAQRQAFTFTVELM